MSSSSDQQADENVDRSTDVLIVGGGISGLSVAYELERAGVSFLLVEKEDRLGGLIGTVRSQGFLMERGPDAFLRDKPPGMALARELGLEAELVPTNPVNKDVFILRGGVLVPMPEGMRLTVPTRILPVLRSPLFSWPGRLRLLAERFIPAKRDRGEESIAEFIERRFGAEALRWLGEPLLAGIHCGRAERLSMDYLFPRLVELERRFGNLTRPLGRQVRTDSAFVSFRGGMGRLIDALTARLPEDSLSIGSGVASLTRYGDRFRALDGRGMRVAARAVVLAVPLSMSAAIAAGVDDALGQSLGGFAFASTAIVYLGFDRASVSHPMEGYGFVVPATENTPLLAGTFVSSKIEGRAPEGRVLVRVFLGGHREPTRWQESDDSLIALACEELERAVGPCGAPAESLVVRWPDRTPQVELGHRDRVERVERRLAEIPGMFLTANGFRGVGIPDCIGEARRVGGEVRDWILQTGPRSEV